MKLQDCLAKLPFRNLLVIARLLDVRRGQNTPKAELVERLTRSLQRVTVLERALQQLTDDERQALDALIAAGGEMPWMVFQEHFGDLRPYRPWRADAPRRPWETPISPAEGLWFRGLIYRLPRHPRTTYDVRVLIPEELLERLPSPSKPPVADAAVEVDAEERPAALGDIATDVALLISLLHREDIEPLWERWLAPRYYHDLNARLSVSEDLREVRSELQTHRLRFVHYVAEAAGLVGLAGRWLKPTPQAWGWLDQAPAERYQTLWSAWTAQSEANLHLWQRYRLPGHDVGEVLEILEVVLGYLVELERGDWYAVDTFSEQLVETESILSALPPAWRDDEVYDVGRETVAGLLEGPLAWWGVVCLEEQDGQPAFALTPAGESWLVNAENVPARGAAAFRVYDDLAVIVPSPSRLRALVRLEAMAEWQGWIDDRRAYQVTPASLSRALSWGMSVETIIDVLSCGGGETLADGQVELLASWAADVRSVSLRNVTLLEARDAEHLQKLSAKRAMREHFRETLSPRAVVVDTGRVESLLRALERQAVWPQVDLPLGEVADDPVEDAGAAVYLWVAGRVYTQLSRWIDLPTPMPAAVLDDLKAQMSPEVLAVARQMVEDTLDRLTEAMDGWARYPMPEAGLPPEETLPVIENAIEAGETLEMTYWTAGRGERTHRTVDPYRIERHGKVPYLIGYCHARMDERVFRVDRIQKVQIVD